MVYLKHTIPLQMSKGCLPQILLGPFLNILPHFIIGTIGGLKQKTVNLKCNYIVMLLISSNIYLPQIKQEQSTTKAPY